MPALPTVVSDYLTAVKDALKEGTDLGQSVRGAALNYLRAQDMATVLDLLQDAMDQSSALTATGGSTTTVVDGAATFVPGQQDGNYVVFDPATTTVALRGLSFRIRSSTATTLTVDLMPAAAQAGDTYTIVGGWFDDHIADLREGKGLADSPSGSIYGESRTVMDALVLGLRRYGLQATATLVATDQPANTNTVVVGSKTYTFQTTLTDVDGNVQIGGDAAESMSNLVAAITLGAGSGTAYAASMTANPDATAALDGQDATGLTAIMTALLAGTAGNSLASTETHANASYTNGATFVGGDDGGSGVVAERSMSHPSLQTAAGSTTTRVVLDTLGVDLRIDQFRGLKAVVGANTPRIVVSSDEDSITVAPALSGAPTASTAVALTIPADDVGGTSAQKMRVHPGAQPGENATLAELIEQLEAVMVAFVLPT